MISYMSKSPFLHTLSMTFFFFFPLIVIKIMVKPDPKVRKIFGKALMGLCGFWVKSVGKCS